MYHLFGIKQIHEYHVVYHGLGWHICFKKLEWNVVLKNAESERIVLPLIFNEKKEEKTKPLSLRYSIFQSSSLPLWFPHAFLIIFFSSSPRVFPVNQSTNQKHCFVTFGFSIIPDLSDSTTPMCYLLLIPHSVPLLRGYHWLVNNKCVIVLLSL